MDIALAVFPELTALDILGPYQVLTRLPGATVRFVSAQRGQVRDDLGLVAFPVEHTYDDVTAPDVVVVPGGTITRRMAKHGDPIVPWIRAVHPTTTYTTSVCTGSLLLGAAGILTGLDATSHWAALEPLEEYGARPTLQRVVEQGKIITAAGVSSGIDMALVLAARLAGDAAAQGIQLGIEYDPQPPFDAGSPEKAPPVVVAAVRARIGRRIEEMAVSSPPASA
ncbi:MAG TPA: DJ-1/PfpI family protein [Acidimicrobiales bacterium]|nr:DJ-1/PfpI family protein [Acidimicrobiales bacterium]